MAPEGSAFNKPRSQSLGSLEADKTKSSLQVGLPNPIYSVANEYNDASKKDVKGVFQADPWNQNLWLHLRRIDERLKALEATRITGSDISIAFTSTASEEVPRELSPKTEQVREPAQVENTLGKKENISNTIIPGLNRVTWPAFTRNADQGRDIQEKYAIDVLVGEPVIYHHVWEEKSLQEHPVCLKEFSERSSLGLSGVTKNLGKLSGEKHEVGYSDVEEPCPLLKDDEGQMIFRGFYHPIPDRIRINGTHLRQLLQKILDIEINTSDIPVVILKPFKLLEFYEDVIRGLYERLSENFSKEKDVYSGPVTAETEAIEAIKAAKAAQDVEFLKAAALAEATDAAEDSILAQIVAENADDAEAIDAFETPEIFKAIEAAGVVEASEAAEVAAGPKRPSRADIFEKESCESLLQVYGTQQAFKELKCLIDFMDHDLKVLKHFEDRSMNRIYFSDLWFIFRPGGEVITSQKPLDAYRVLQVAGGRPYLSPPKERKENDTTSQVPEKSSDFRITCYQIGFDGVKFRPLFKVFYIPRYEGLQDINTFPIYPLRFDDDWEATRSTLQQSGRNFIRLSKRGHVQYSGMSLSEAERIDAQIVVDFEEAFRDNQDASSEIFRIDFGTPPSAEAPMEEVVMTSIGGCNKVNCCENDVIYNDFDIDRLRTEGSITNREFLTMGASQSFSSASEIPKKDHILFSSQLFAFDLKDRKWVVVDANNIKKLPKATSEGWDYLELPKGPKKLIKSLSQAHFREQAQADLIRGKGIHSQQYLRTDLIFLKDMGLIILLQGPPGVGKTSTAERIAEFCNRPFYRVVCGDLGITPEVVEMKLKRIFAQAQRWKCVLLLDEADILLRERGQDIKRNSMVSVFIRAVESYRGVLFLTTSFVGKLDEGVRSRVHTSFYYPSLSRESTAKIFEANLSRSEEIKGESMRFKKDEILNFAKGHYERHPSHLRWNGREIGHAFQMAIALAENDAANRNKENKKKGKDQTSEPRLGPQHFEAVEEASIEFGKHVNATPQAEQTDATRPPVDTMAAMTYVPMLLGARTNAPER
ncbi:MAG: hypothetical protein M1822_008005 [Bathelium mastoideum]|nr:MAG: hypothetical protein M1822_008005 [Bathelium mastoideum]